MKIKNSVKMEQDLRIWSMRFTRMYRIKRLFVFKESAIPVVSCQRVGILGMKDMLDVTFDSYQLKSQKLIHREIMGGNYHK